MRFLAAPFDVLAVALGEAHGSHRQADVEVVEDELGRAAADVEHERAGRRIDAAPRQLRFLVAGEQLRDEAVAPFHLAEEGFAVLRVAHRARGGGECPLGAERLERAPVVREDVAHARDGEGEEAAARVDALAQPRDARLAMQLIDPAVGDVGDEQPRRVRAEVDGRDSHLRGMSAVNLVASA